MLPRELPFARREAVAALKDTYTSKDEALAGIDARLRKFYAQQAAAKRPSCREAIAAVQEVCTTQRVSRDEGAWGTYPNNIGHNFFNGCFRCHDEQSQGERRHA